MSGHSKWSTIKRKKEKTDAGRAKIFTKIGREISVAVRDGGADPNSNAKLRELIAKAKQNNVPNDNIERIIKKAQGDGDKSAFEEIVYEGYGPCGVAVIVNALTDNKNRTAADVRHYFDKYGGNLGTSGCVSFMFAKKGVIMIEGTFEEDKVMNDVLEAGAIDFDLSAEGVEIFTDTAELFTVKEALEGMGYTITSAEIEQIPSTYVKIENEDDAKKMQTLLDLLYDNDDVQNIWHNLLED